MRSAAQRLHLDQTAGRPGGRAAHRGGCGPSVVPEYQTARAAIIPEHDCRLIDGSASRSGANRVSLSEGHGFPTPTWAAVASTQITTTNQRARRHPSGAPGNGSAPLPEGTSRLDIDGLPSMPGVTVMSETITTATDATPITTIEPTAKRAKRTGRWEVIVLGGACAITIAAALTSICTLGVQ